MTIKHLTATDYILSPWKNGQGTTTQIKIYPEYASLAELNFTWRISSAQISSTNTFSEFPGFERLLTVFDGNGVILNHKELWPYEVYAFAGKEKIQCELIDGEVVDLGVIFNPLKVTAFISVFEGNGQPVLLSTNPDDYHLFFCSDNFFQHKQTQVKKGESLEISDENAVTLQTFPNSKIIHIKISEI